MMRWLLRNTAVQFRLPTGCVPGWLLTGAYFELRVLILNKASAAYSAEVECNKVLIDECDTQSVAFLSVMNNWNLNGCSCRGMGESRHRA